MSREFWGFCIVMAVVFLPLCGAMDQVVKLLREIRSLLVDLREQSEQTNASLGSIENQIVLLEMNADRRPHGYD